MTPNYIVFRELFKWSDELNQIATYDRTGDIDFDDTMIITSPEFNDWCNSNYIKYDLKFISYSTFYVRFFNANDATKFIEKYKGAA